MGAAAGLLTGLGIEQHRAFHVVADRFVAELDPNDPRLLGNDVRQLVPIEASENSATVRSGHAVRPAGVSSAASPSLLSSTCSAATPQHCLVAGELGTCYGRGPSVATNALRLGFLCSHGGTILQAVLEACQAGVLDAAIAVVISNNSRSLALERARRAGIPWYHLSGHTHPDPTALDAAMSDALDTHGAQVVVLAGYMKLLGSRTLDRYAGRIVNVHPALLPGFGGTGMYGDRVHAAVLAAGDRTTGVTVHLADAEYDHWAILARREIPVEPGDTVESLRQRVQRHEGQLLVEVLQHSIRPADRQDSRGLSRI